MSSATIANQLAAKIALSQAAEAAADGANTEKESVGGGTNSKADLLKPSMMSVAESVAAEEKDQVPLGGTLGKTSVFKATVSGLSQSSLTFGKSIHNSNFRNIAKSTIAPVSVHIESMEMPKKFRIALKKKALEEKKKKLAEEKAEREAAEAAGVKMPKKPKTNKFAFPTPDPLPPPKDLTVAEAMAGAESWNAANVIANKFSVGTLTTAKYKQKADVFRDMNQLADDVGSLYP